VKHIGSDQLLNEGMKAPGISGKIKFATLLLSLISILAVIVAQNPASSDRASQHDEQDDVVRVETNLVTIPASVMDRRL
jgi:hypothetical protein